MLFTADVSKGSKSSDSSWTPDWETVVLMGDRAVLDAKSLLLPPKRSRSGRAKSAGGLGGGGGLDGLAGLVDCIELIGSSNSAARGSKSSSSSKTVVFLITSST